MCRLRFQKRKYIQAVSDFPLQSLIMIKLAFFFNFVSNIQCFLMTDVVKFCTSGTLVKKLLNNFYSLFLNVEVQIEQIKMI